VLFLRRADLGLDLDVVPFVGPDDWRERIARIAVAVDAVTVAVLAVIGRRVRRVPEARIELRDFAVSARLECEGQIALVTQRLGAVLFIRAGPVGIEYAQADRLIAVVHDPHRAVADVDRLDAGPRNER